MTETGLSKRLQRYYQDVGAGVTAATHDDVTEAAKANRTATGQEHEPVDEAAEDSFPASDPPSSGQYT